jgi:hypothetical protein
MSNAHLIRCLDVSDFLSLIQKGETWLSVMKNVHSGPAWCADASKEAALLTAGAASAKGTEHSVKNEWL